MRVGGEKRKSVERKKRGKRAREQKGFFNSALSETHMNPHSNCTTADHAVVWWVDADVQ